MTILLVSPLPPAPYPEADYARALAERLAGAGGGSRVHVLCQAGAETPADVRAHPVMRDWSWRDAGRLRRVLRTVRPESLLIYWFNGMYNYHPLVTLLPTVAKRMFPRVRVVTQVSVPYGAWPWAEGLAGRIRHKWARLRAGRDADYQLGTLRTGSDALVFLCRLHREELTRGRPDFAAKSHILPHPPFLRKAPESPETRAAARAALGVRPEEFLFLNFGRLYPEKGVGTLLEAFLRLAETDPAARLAVVGGAAAYCPDYPAELHARADALGLGGRVRWTGEFSWDGDDGSRLLQAADACVLPFERGLHLNNSSFLAAAAHGKAVVSTTGPLPDPELADGETVLLVPPNEPEALAGAMQRLRTDAALRDRIGRAARLLAEETFGWDAFLPCLTAVLAHEPGSSTGC